MHTWQLTKVKSVTLPDNKGTSLIKTHYGKGTRRKAVQKCCDKTYDAHGQGHREGGGGGQKGQFARVPLVRGAPHTNIALKFQQPQASAQLGIGRRLSVHSLINVHPMSRDHPVLWYMV